jgi:hypothetical protein
LLFLTIFSAAYYVLLADHLISPHIPYVLFLLLRYFLTSILFLTTYSSLRLFSPLLRGKVFCATLTISQALSSFAPFVLKFSHAPILLVVYLSALAQLAVFMIEPTQSMMLENENSNGVNNISYNTNKQLSEIGVIRK